MDWANLNSDLLHLIAKKVHNIFDIIQLRAVCTSWRLAVLPSDLPPQLPFFICFRRNGGLENDLEIVCPFTKRTQTLFTSKANKKGIILGSSIRYVLLYDCSSSSASIINPFTGLRIPIPFQIEGDSRDVFIAPHSSPTGNAIDVMFSSTNRLNGSLACLWRYDGHNWLKITETPYRFYDEKVCYNNGRLSFFSTKKIKIIDVNRGLECVISNLPVAFDYLIEAFGNLIAVKKVFNSRIFQIPIEDDEKYIFEVYWLDNTGNVLCWSKMNNGFANWIIFLDQQSGFCMKADDFDGLRGNCIYFTTIGTHDNLFFQYLVRYDIELGKSRVLCKYKVCKGQGVGHWFVPGLH